MSGILCPSGHRHLLPLLEGSCWLGEDELREVSVTMREFDVAQELLRSGAGNKTIAQRLYVTEDTVKSHLKHLLARTGAANRTELVVAVFRGRLRLKPVPVAASVMWSASDDALVP